MKYIRGCFPHATMIRRSFLTNYLMALRTTRHTFLRAAYLMELHTFFENRHVQLALENKSIINFHGMLILKFKEYIEIKCV